MSPADELLLESVLESFDRAWRTPTPPRLEDFLPREGTREYRQAVLRELVGTDLEYRLVRGEPGRLEDYLARFGELADDPDAVTDLAAWEFVLRRQSDPAVAAQEYLDRFPRHADALRPLLASESATASTETGPGPVSGQSTTPPLTRVVPAARPTDPQVPRRLGSYELLGRLGKGGMGEVYRARHIHLDKLFAVKVISEEWAHAPELLNRFRREVLAAGRVEHPNLVRATDAGEADGTLFLVMELLDGEDLAYRVEQLGPLPVAQACAAVRQAALGLQAAHERGLVHRDVKPHNLFLTIDGVVKVLDLGLARLRGPGASGREGTAAGAFMGTADYAAPEQFLDARGVEAAADIYSLGCTLYHLLAGRPPFGKATHPDTVTKARAHLNEPPPDLRHRRADVPEGLSAVLVKMLAKRPQERYAGMAEVAAALAAFIEPAAQAATPSLPKTVRLGPQKGNRRHVWAAVGLAAVPVAVLLAWAGWKWRDQPTPMPPYTSRVAAGKHALAPPPPAKPLTIRMAVYRYEPEAGNMHRLGELGKDTYHARLDDRVEVEAALSEPAYAYLIAFNPTQDLRAAATYRLAWAVDTWSLAAHLACRQSAAPSPAAFLLGTAEAAFRADPGTAEHLIPKRLADREPRQRERVATEGRLRLNDGVGLQVLAVVASRQPLPSYTEWRRRRPPLDWTQTAATSGVVWLTDGKTFRGVHGPGVDVRAEDEKDDKTVVRTLAEELRHMPGVEAVSVVGFAVDRAD
jgi:hypothetical protein